MPERVDARDVLDENASTAKPFRAKVLGHFRRTGPNAWDDYVFVRTDDEQVLEVHAGIQVSLERNGCDVRLRSHGRVLRVRWVPTAEDVAALSEATPAERRRYFVEHCLAPFDGAPGMGAAAIIARKLGE